MNFRNSRQVHRALLCILEATYALVINMLLIKRYTVFNKSLS